MDMNIEKIKKHIELRTNEKAEYCPEETTVHGRDGRVYEDRTFQTARTIISVRWPAWETENPEVIVMMYEKGTDEADETRPPIEGGPVACFRRYIDDLDQDVISLIDTIFNKDDAGVNVYDEVEDALSTLSYGQVNCILEDCHAKSMFEIGDHLMRKLRPTVELMVSDAVDKVFIEDILDSAVWGQFYRPDGTYAHLSDWLNEHKTI